LRACTPLKITEQKCECQLLCQPFLDMAVKTNFR
jgi:hypothetical protein